MRSSRSVRAALAAGAVLLSLVGQAPARAATGDEISCTGQLTSWSRDAYDDWVGDGSATCAVADNDTPTGATVGSVPIYAVGFACVGGGWTFRVIAGGHVYYLGYTGAGTLGGGAEAGVLTAAQKDSRLYLVTALDPMAGAAVVFDARATTGVCAGYLEPRPTIAFTFHAMLPTA